MDASEHVLHPVAVVLHTRDRQEDYHWYAEVGLTELFTKLREFHRGLIADQDAKPAETFMLMETSERLGLLVANLKTTRYDHTRARIDDAIFLQFTAGDREAVLRLAAGLLRAEAQQLHGILLEYAEQRYQEQQRTGQIKPEGLGVVLPLPFPGSTDMPSADRIGLRSNEANQRRVAGFLEEAASHPNLFRRPFVVVSTGFVGKEKLGQQAAHCEQFVALSRSSSLHEGEETALCKKKDGRSSNESAGGGHDLGGALRSVVAGGLGIAEQALENTRDQIARLRERIDRRPPDK